MTHILTRQLQGSAAWMARDFENGNSAWVHHLSASEVGIIDGALADLRSRGRSFPDFSAEDFPIHALRPKLSDWAEELENGRGFLLLRGLPIDRYSDGEINALYYGIGLHMGQPVCQNPRGDLLGEVMNVGDIQDKNTRVYQTNLYLPYHSDPSDVVGLLCVRKARRGGLSSLVSVASVHNRLLAEHREHLGLYYRLWSFAHLCEPQPSLSPIFSFNQGKLSCRYLRQYIELGHVICGLPLSTVEKEALDLFDAVMLDPAMRMDMMLEPGDLQFANNYAVLHSRNDFEDHDDPAQRRRLLRLWLKMPNARALAPEFPGRNGFPPPHPADA
jgi:hypothetical protein